MLYDMKLLNYLFCDMFGSVLECYELTHISWLSTPGNHAWLNRHCYPIGCVIKSPHQGICSCSPIVNFFKFTFHHGMATSVIFLITRQIWGILIAAAGLVTLFGQRDFETAWMIVKNNHLQMKIISYQINPAEMKAIVPGIHYPFVLKWFDHQINDLP